MRVHRRGSNLASSCTCPKGGKFQHRGRNNVHHFFHDRYRYEWLLHESHWNVLLSAASSLLQRV